MRSSKSPHYIVQGEGQRSNGFKRGDAKETISEMPANSLVTQEEKAKQHNVEKAPRIIPEKPLSKGPLESCKRKDMAGIGEDLFPLRGIVKNDASFFQKNRKIVYSV